MRFFGRGRSDLSQRLDVLEKALLDHKKSIHFLEGQRIRTVRQFAAMQSLVESLIRTHPRPDMMLRWWNHEVPKLIDEVGRGRSDLSQRLDVLEKALLDHKKSIHFLEGQRIRTVRQFAAMQSLVESLIRTHPRPDMMLRWWNHEVPKLIDEVSQRGARRYRRRTSIGGACLAGDGEALYPNINWRRLPGRGW
ncbi:hypothetical protein [Xanthomonas sp. MUS 060]|uniref:hypothetical protein n=1 Tax=Xanthomonas sp. MUS 060 TaxID=1588031 RepID=UPI00126A0E80|nr:hypothetical protein [Xanthomonas sp. MUS 060]